MKNRLFDNTLQLNVEAFHWKYSDQQISYLTVIGGGPDFPIANAESTIQGLDVDVLWAATDATTIGGQIQLLDATLDEASLVSDVGAGRFGCPLGPINSDGFQTYDCSGQSLLYSPEFSANLSVTHVFDLGNYEITGVADFSYKGEQGTEYSFLPETVADAYTTVNLEATLTKDDANWAATAYVRNATDERYVVSSNIGVPGLLHQQFNPPMVYGVRLRTEF